MIGIDPITRLLGHESGHHGPVALTYHSVSPGHQTPAWPWSTSLSRFESHLDFLAGNGWHCVTMNQLAQCTTSFPVRTIAITFDDGYIDNLHALEALAQRGMTATWFIVSGSIGRTPEWRDHGQPQGRLLNADELVKLRQAGMEVGSHTATHARLISLPDQDLAHELALSRSQLETVLGESVHGFAYPYGAWDNRVADAVRQAGYQYACTTDSGWALRDNNPYRIRRLTVFNHDSTASLARKLYFGSNEASWFKAVRHVAHRVRSRVTT